MLRRPARWAALGVVVLALACAACSDDDVDGAGAPPDLPTTLADRPYLLGNLPTLPSMRPTGPPADVSGASVQGFVVEDLSPRATVEAYADLLTSWRTVDAPAPGPNGTWEASFRTRAQGLRVVAQPGAGGPDAAPSQVTLTLSTAS